MTTVHQAYETTDQVAARYQVSTRYLRDLVKDGKVRPLRLSSAKNAPMRFGPEQCQQIEAAMTPPPPAEPVRRRRRSRRT